MKNFLSNVEIKSRKMLTSFEFGYVWSWRARTIGGWGLTQFVRRKGVALFSAVRVTSDNFFYSADVSTATKLPFSNHYEMWLRHFTNQCSVTPGCVQLMWCPLMHRSEKDITSAIFFKQGVNGVVFPPWLHFHQTFWYWAGAQETDPCFPGFRSLPKSSLCLI